MTRPKSFYDGPTPSGASVAAHNFLRLAKLTGNDDLRLRAETIVKLYQIHFEKGPDQFANMICALDQATTSGQEIVCVAEASCPEFKKLIHTAGEFFLPDAVQLAVDWKKKNDLGSADKLIADRIPVGGKPTVYICENYVCKEPLTDSDKLQLKLKEMSS